MHNTQEMNYLEEERSDPGLEAVTEFPRLCRRGDGRGRRSCMGTMIGSTSTAARTKRVTFDPCRIDSRRGDYIL